MTKIVVGIMERVAKINGVIPERALVTVDQRAIHLDSGEVTCSIAAASGNMAEMMYGAEKDAVGNGGGAPFRAPSLRLQRGRSVGRCSGLIRQRMLLRLIRLL